MFLLIFNVTFHLVITNLFIHVVPRLHEVMLNIKIAHYFLIQLDENCEEAFCNLIFHIIVGLVILIIIFQLRNKAILSKMLSSEIAGLKTTKADFFLARRNNYCIVFVVSL